MRWVINKAKEPNSRRYLPYMVMCCDTSVPIADVSRFQSVCEDAAPFLCGTESGKDREETSGQMKTHCNSPGRWSWYLDVPPLSRADRMWYWTLDQSGHAPLGADQGVQKDPNASLPTKRNPLQRRQFSRSLTQRVKSIFSES